MSRQRPATGRIQPAPEGFLDARQVDAVRKGRRGFLKRALAAAVEPSPAPPPPRAPSRASPRSSNCPSTPKGLGQPVAARRYGLPSRVREGLQRRAKPRPDPGGRRSVTFAPLQGLFGIITPSGLHFERHHQGWWDIDPTKHRLMVNGMVKRERVFTMDDLMRLPSVSRIHFIECGANTPPSGATSPCPPCNTRTAWSAAPSSPACCCPPCWRRAASTKSPRKFVLAEGADGSSMTRTIDDRARPWTTASWPGP